MHRLLNYVLLLSVTSIFTISCKKNDPLFTRLDETSTGITFANQIFEKDSFNILHNEYIYNGGGVGIIDVNKDGLEDLFFTGNTTSSKFYLNKGNFKFEEFTHIFKGLDSSQWISGVVVADVNADGFDDVYLTSTNSNDPNKRKNQLWINQGHKIGQIPEFINKAEEYGVADSGYGVHAAFLDYDVDGDLDLYVLNNIINKEVPTNYRTKMLDGSSVNNDRLYRNNGNNTFTDVTMEAGITIEGFGLGIAVGDVNKDGYPDLYISNDYIANDILYINQKNGSFKNEIKNMISYQSRFSMGNDMADVNNDGFPEIITTDMMPELYSRKKQTINGNSYNVYVYNNQYGYENQYVRNMLHLHNGILDSNRISYSEIGQIAGIYQTEWSWSPLFADYDNDGDRDLIITNGFPKDLTDKDFTNYKAQFYGHLAGDEDILPKIPIVKVSNYAFENSGKAIFKDVTKQWGMDIPSFSNGAAFTDLDNDGDLDYVVNNINDKAFVYKNNTINKEKSTGQNNYIKINLKGNTPNTNAIGAKVEIWSKDNYMFYEHFLSRGYISSVTPIIHFGLGSTNMLDSICITWPNHKTKTILKNVKSDQLLTLQERQSAQRSIAQIIGHQTHFVPYDTSFLPYYHNQTDYVDFYQYQNIMPQKFSQTGPFISKGDLNNDGDDDILIAGSFDFPTTAYLYKNGNYIKSEIPNLTGLKKAMESCIQIVDINGDKMNDVVVSSGGYANEKIEEYVHKVYYNQNGTFKEEKLPVPSYIASVSRVEDFNKDGFPDIFIGRRVDRTQFPKSGSSYLLINSKKGFLEKDKIALEADMVTDAVWSDYDADGWKDLLVLRSWNSLVLYKNLNGKSLQPDKVQAISDKKGYWQSITAADLDQDGLDDYVLGNLGENHRFNVGKKYPLKLYGIDIDNNGSIDPIKSGFWKDNEGKMQEYPVNYLDELAAQSAFFRKSFTSYQQFSFTNMSKLLQNVKYNEKDVLSINDCSSYILWNEGKTKFKWEKLPVEAQYSPLKKSITYDVNKDKLPDLILTGNDFSFDVSTGVYNANKGLILLNKNNRQFEVVPVFKSGLNLGGQCESVVSLDKPKEILIFGINRGKLESYELK